MPIKLKRDDFRWKNGRGHDQRPLLYSLKRDNHGIGRPDPISDQWWERAFDSQLKSLDVSQATTGEVVVKQTADNATPKGLARVARYSIKFVRASVLVGDREVAPAKEQEQESKSTAQKESAPPKVEEKQKGKRRPSKRDRKKIKAGEVIEQNKVPNRKERKSLARQARKEERKEAKREKRRLNRLVQREIAALTAAAGYDTSDSRSPGYSSDLP